MAAMLGDVTMEPEADDIATQVKRIAPVVWLVGKVQAGKTSIIRALTGASEAEVGAGYKACTKASRVFDFPEEAPLIRFLDTRGLGEAKCDLTEDIELARGRSHATIAVMRALDPRQQAVIDVLKELRKEDPDWPIIVAQTHLHEAYPKAAHHPAPYPFPIVSSRREHEATPNSLPHVPHELTRALAYQRQAIFDALPGSGPVPIVPIDFTLHDDGFEPRLYGLEELLRAIIETAPSAIRSAMQDVSGGRAQSEGDRHHQLIIGYALAASAADLVPLAATAAVPAVQARLLSVLGARYGVEWTRAVWAEFAGALGGGMIARYAIQLGVRQLVKLIPIYGQTVGTAAAAATSYATTYALGKAATYYLDRKQQHGEVDMAGIKRAWSEALTEAFARTREAT